MAPAARQVRPALPVFQWISGCTSTTCSEDGVDMREWYIARMTESHVSPSPAARHTLVFFDGACGLCNGFVDFLVTRDHADRLRFASLQGDTARACASLPQDVDSVIVVRDGQVQVYSDAAITALMALGGAWRLAAGLRLIPRAVRDGIYRAIARHRYRWFGRRAHCRLPQPHEARWFLP